MDENIDKRGVLDENIFSYRTTKDGKVFISYYGKHVTTLTGEKAKRFISAVNGADDKAAQLVMAKATGNFKHGNER